MNPEPSHASTLELDRHVMGALDPERTRALEAHLAQCERCRQEQAALRSAHGEFTAEIFPRTAARLAARPRPAPEPVPFFRRPLVWAPALAAAAALLLFVNVGGRARETAPNPALLAAKGACSLSLVARRAGQVFAASGPKVGLAAGDELRFVVTSDASAHTYLLIASVDGAGHTNVYFPFAGARSGAVAQPGRWEVPGSVVLDSSRGPERIFALFSAAPLEAAQVTEPLARIGQRGWDAIRSDAEISVAGAEAHSVLIERVGK
jgi:hypothetical protein